MDISKAQIERILETLPIGYYINRRVETKLTDENCSYYDPMNDSISISSVQLMKVLQTLNSPDIEKDIRCLLYHETSHALLTPKRLTINAIMNIFEDERIETLLRYHYRDVNFREFVVRMNNYQGQDPTTADELYYHIVRFRKGPKHFLTRVYNIINKFHDLNRMSEYTYDYECRVINLYNDIVKYFNDSNAYQQQKNKEREDYIQQKGNDIDDPSLEMLDFTDTEDTKETIDRQYNKNDINNSINNVVNAYESSEYDNDINQILLSVKKSTKQNSSAIHAYSGVFNPRAVVRDDYKYFVQQNRQGHAKAYSKLHLNLFIDCSGSFQHNDVITNKLLKSLLKFECSNPQFTFDLIACGRGQKILDKQHRVQQSRGCNHLTSDIFSQFKQLQFRDAENMNIVLFDGDAFSYLRPVGSEYQNFKAFDTKNTIIISDPENDKYLYRACKSAKVIITKQYTNELYKNVITSLKQLCR